MNEAGSTSYTATYTYSGSTTNTNVAHSSWWSGPPDMGVVAWVPTPPDHDDGGATLPLGSNQEGSTR